MKIFLKKPQTSLACFFEFGYCDCVKSVCIRSFSDLYFPAFGLNTPINSVRMWKNTDQKTPNTGTFHALY